MDGYEAIAKILKLEGVEWMACFPSNPLIEAVAKEGIRPIMFRQERGGIMAADGYSRTMNSSKFGVFACQGGPGAENSYGAIAQAWADSVPILFLPDGVAHKTADVKPSFWASRAYKDITKWSESINDSQRIVPLMRRAFHALKNGRPGPVLLEMHEDHMQNEVTNLEEYKTQVSMPVSPSISSIKDSIKILLSAKNPIIWSGQGVIYGNATKELRKFSELLKIPVVTTMPGKSSFDERHPLSLGSANRTAPKAVWHWLKESDLVFAVGSSLTITKYGITIPEGKNIIHSTNNLEDINKDYSVECGLYGDSKMVLDSLLNELNSNKKSIEKFINDKETNIQDDIQKIKKDWMKEWIPYLESSMEPINPYRLINEINNNIDHEKSIITHDAGHPRDQIMPFLTSTIPNSYIGWGKTTHLGYGIPLMIGAKIAHPDKFCMNFMGDAAFGMSGLDIETAVRSDNPITTVLMNNSTMGGYSVRYPQSIERYGAINLSGDYAKIAEGMGAIGIRVTKTEEIGKAIQKAQKHNKDGKTVLIDVKTQPELKMSVY